MYFSLSRSALVLFGRLFVPFGVKLFKLFLQAVVGGAKVSHPLAVAAGLWLTILQPPICDALRLFSRWAMRLSRRNTFLGYWLM